MHSLSSWDTIQYDTTEKAYYTEQIMRNKIMHNKSLTGVNVTISIE